MAVSGEPDVERGETRKRIVVIAGPTGSGKSSLAIAMARKYGAEVISADSRQIFRQLKIGTDRLDKEEWQGVPHHLMGCCDLDQRFTAFDFVERSRAVIDEVYRRGGRIIVCGGTGLYIRALTDGIFELPDTNMAYRNELLDIAATEGPRHVHEMLAAVDPEEAAAVHYNNMIRVIRALEIYRLTGRPKSELKAETEPVDKSFDFLQLILMPGRDDLYKRIENRVDEMMARGLPAEAESVYRSALGKALTDARIVGYSELIDYFEDRISLDEAIRLIKQNTRRYAKRQFTWFRRVKRAVFLPSFGAAAEAAGSERIGPFWDAKGAQ